MTESVLLWIVGTIVTIAIAVTGFFLARWIGQLDERDTMALDLINQISVRNAKSATMLDECCNRMGRLMERVDEQSVKIQTLEIGHARFKDAHFRNHKENLE